MSDSFTDFGFLDLVGLTDHRTLDEEDTAAAPRGSGSWDVSSDFRLEAGTVLALFLSNLCLATTPL